MLTSLRTIGIETTSQTVDFMFKLADNDGDGKINCS